MATDSIGLLSGTAGSAELIIRSQKCPLMRTGETRTNPEDTCNVFITSSPAPANLISYVPSLLAANRQTISWAAGTCTAGAVIVISGGNSKETSFMASLLFTRTVRRNDAFAGIPVDPRYRSNCTISSVIG